jgi:hypothetical protein
LLAYSIHQGHRPQIRSTPSSIEIGINRIDLLNLAADGTRDSLGRVNISEEASGVLLDLLDVEAEAVVLASGSVDNTGDETVLGAGDAADAAAGVLAVGDLHGVGEGDARRTGLALDGLVDVGGRDGGRLVLALEAGDGDVVADDVLVAVEAEFVDTAGALEAAGEGVVGVDDLLRDSDHFVGGGELEGRGLGNCVWLVSLMDRCDEGDCLVIAYPLPCCYPNAGPSACPRWG